MKLFTIGDSVSQGFMSGAAARTDLCYSTILAQSLRLTPGDDYHVPAWPKGGHPVDLERLFRVLSHKFGANIAGPIEWFRAIRTISDVLDDVEDYYERGAGGATKPAPEGVAHYHNIAIRGFDVADAWLVTPRLCRTQIDRAGDKDDNLFGAPGASFYRTALSVLNPQRKPEFDDFSALDWLKRHATGESGEGGIENCIVWLGANNALGTVLDLAIHVTPGDGRTVLEKSNPERQDYNLWEPRDFEAEYRLLLEKTDAIMRANREANWKVFLGTVPAVTIAPLAKGVGEAVIKPDPFERITANGPYYYRYYTYVIFDEAFAHTSDVRLGREEAYIVDSYIARYNKTIRRLAADLNAAHGEQRYFVVDIAGALLDMAYKRNNGNPPYELPATIADLIPRPNTKFYHANRRGTLVQGGIFSLDGVHPTAIGHGLVAHEFMKVMKQAAGVSFERGIDWQAIVDSDALWREPIDLMTELYENEHLAKVMVYLMRCSSRRQTEDEWDWDDIE